MTLSHINIVANGRQWLIAVLATVFMLMSFPAAAQTEAPPANTNTPAQQDYIDYITQQLNIAQNGATQEEKNEAILMLVTVGFGVEPGENNNFSNPCTADPPCTGTDYTSLLDTWDSIKNSSSTTQLLEDTANNAASSGNLAVLQAMDDFCNGGGNSCQSIAFDSLIQTAQATRDASEGCTTDPGFEIPVKVGGALNSVTQGNDLGQILIKLSSSVNNIMRSASERLFNYIIADNGYIQAVSAAMVLFLIFYAVGFMLGFTRLSGEEGVMRLVKFAVVVAIMAPTGWPFFNDTVGRLAMEGSDQLINAVSTVSSNIASKGMQTEPCEYDATGLTINNAMGGLACTLNRVLSLKMLVILASLAYTGVYGILFAVLLGFGIFMFLKAAVDAIWAYLVSVVFRVALLAMAPIFITFLLFNRTRQLFNGWLNQLISYSLQPVFVFAFLGFFLILIEGYLNRIMNVELCLGRIPDFIQGTGFDIHLYRFMVPDAGGNLVDWPGDWGRGENINGQNIPAPMDIVDVLMFCILSLLASSFVGMADGLARTVAGIGPSGATFGGMTGMIGQAMGSATNWVKAQTLGRVPYVGGFLSKGGLK